MASYSSRDHGTHGKVSADGQGADQQVLAWVHIGAGCRCHFRGGLDVRSPFAVRWTLCVVVTCGLPGPISGPLYQAVALRFYVHVLLYPPRRRSDLEIRTGSGIHGADGRERSEGAGPVEGVVADLTGAGRARADRCGVFLGRRPQVGCDGWACLRQWRCAWFFVAHQRTLDGPL